MKSSDGDFETQAFFQPLPTFVGQGSSNILGIDRHTSNGVVLLASLAARGAGQESLERELMMRWKAELEEYAKGLGGLFDYLYMNYAHSSQDVLAGYGEENVRKMRHVAKKYDPFAVMQRRQPGGFKLPVDDHC